MIQRPGKLGISPEGNMSLNGLRLAIRGVRNPLTAATNFIRGNNLGRDDSVIVNMKSNNSMNVKVRSATLIKQSLISFNFRDDDLQSL